MEVGSVCVKIAGRDAGLACVIVEKIDSIYVMIDGQTRRRKCNIAHLEMTGKTLPIKKGSHDEVKKLFESGMDIKITDTKPKEKKERPRKQRKSKQEKEETKDKKKPAKEKIMKKEEKAKKPEKKSE